MQLAADGALDEWLVVIGHDGFHRQPILRRGFAGAHIARAGEGEVERARDGRGAEREHIHMRAELLEAFLVRDAEALFLVDDHEAEILEFHIRLHQPMRADDNIHRAQGLVGLADQCAHGVAVTQVEGQYRTPFSQLRRQRLQRIDPGARQSDSGARAMQMMRDRATYAARSAGHQGGFSRKIKHGSWLPKTAW